MTPIQRTTSGLRFIPRPSATWIERTGFIIMRSWRWAGIVASSVLTAGVMILSMSLAAWHHPAAPLRSGYVGFLVAIPLIAMPVWHLSRIELHAAPAWMIRAALATATDDARAYLFERLLQFATSEWRQDPIACGVLIDLFKEAKLVIAARGKVIRERMMAERGRQVEVLQNVLKGLP
ncbi:hypothetical protein [Porphyrobacter sp. YT40]|uniref:hypothetical protein n=1 Tax=Porphyrobacter sp. YT40 TaxID=2547601 RepID=UPI0011420A51|nr:hypothetical protein [Porphyrobacter sp. YT40]QDH34173.1 hypothetical protein E2E27_07450 [Porphyrobacter sp. YT40]